jgi:hypothetical protein
MLLRASNPQFAGSLTQLFIHMCRTNALCYTTEHGICHAICLSLRLEEKKIPRFLEKWEIQALISKTMNIFLPPCTYREIQAFLSVVFQGAVFLHIIHEFLMNFDLDFVQFHFILCSNFLLPHLDSIRYYLSACLPYVLS